MSHHIAVLGAGSWGTALAILLARNGHRVSLWGHESDVMQKMAAAGENHDYLPGIPFPHQLQATGDLDAALAADDILIVVPSHAFRQVLQQIQPKLQRHSRIAWGTKGLEMASAKLLHRVANEVLGDSFPCAVVSGPTFAKEVAKGLPTAATVASSDLETAEHYAALLRGKTFRAYTSSDVIGLELGGSIKNVLAIAAGISDGLGFGANSRAALITRGLVEMMRLGEALGGRRETFMGLSGIGDLVLTCTDDQSRNRRLGLALGEGRTREQAEREIRQVIEGADTAREIHKIGRAHEVDMPICEQVYKVLYEGHAPQAAVHDLLAREPKPENLV